jgi:hypothetical protein
MRGRSPHFSAVLVAAIAATALLVLGLSSGALAANPNPHADCNNVLTAPVVSCHFSGSDADPDYCGTGREIDFTFDGHFSLANEPPSVGFRNNSSGTTVLTDPLTGATVLIHSAYRFTDTIVSGDPNGAHTELWVFKGAGETIRNFHGGVIARDAGNLAVEVTFDGVDPDPLNVQIVGDRGDHSLFANGNCSVLVAALGLS